MNKSVFLHISGEDYSALVFEQKYNEQKVYEAMVTEGVKHKILEGDDYYIEVKILEFNKVDSEFVSHIKDNLIDYDRSKDENIFEVIV